MYILKRMQKETLLPTHILIQIIKSVFFSGKIRSNACVTPSKMSLQFKRLRNSIPAGTLNCNLWFSSGFRTLPPFEIQTLSRTHLYLIYVFYFLRGKRTFCFFFKYGKHLATACWYSGYLSFHWKRRMSIIYARLFVYMWIFNLTRLRGTTN